MLQTAPSPALHTGAVTGMSVRHPVSPAANGSGKPQIDFRPVIFGDRGPVRDARFKHRAAPLRGQRVLEARDRIDVLGLSAHDCRSFRGLPVAGVVGPVRGCSQGFVVADPPVEVKGGLQVSLAQTPRDHLFWCPGDKQCGTWLWRHQCGVHPGGPMLRRRSVATSPALCVSRSAICRGSRCIHQQRALICQSAAGIGCSAGDIGGVVGEQPLQVSSDTHSTRPHIFKRAPFGLSARGTISACLATIRSRHRTPSVPVGRGFTVN